MKRKAIIISILLCLLGVVYAESNSLLYFYNDNWFSLQSAQNAVVPEGLSDREIEIYRAGYANGHYDAMNPAFVEGLYVINTKTKKFHLSNCMTTLLIEIENRKHSTETPDELMSQGYKPCGQCNPERYTSE